MQFALGPVRRVLSFNKAMRPAGLVQASAAGVHIQRQRVALGAPIPVTVQPLAGATC